MSNTVLTLRSVNCLMYFARSSPFAPKPVTRASACPTRPSRLRVSLGGHMLSVPAHGMPLRGAHPRRYPPYQRSGTCSSLARSLARLHMVRFAMLRSVDPSVDAPSLTRHNITGCAHVFERKFHGALQTFDSFVPLFAPSSGVS